MSTSTLERPNSGAARSDASTLDDRLLEALAEDVKALFSSRPAQREFELDHIREFLDLTVSLAHEAGIRDEGELRELVDYAARMYVARSIQDQLTGTLQQTLEFPTPPVTRGAAAFFRRFGER